MVSTPMIPAFHEEWFHLDAQECLAGLARQVADIPGLIIEVGSWEGRSTCALANAAHPRVVHAVDTWAGSVDEISQTLAAKRDVFAQWLANVGYWTRGNVEPHRMGWREFATMVEDPVAFLFVDAEHTYKEVRDNIKAFMAKMAPGGIICGDDVHHPPVRKALDEVLPGWQGSGTAVWSWTVPA